MDWGKMAEGCPVPIMTETRIDYVQVQVQVYTQRPRNGRIKLCDCANRETQLSKQLVEKLTSKVSEQARNIFAIRASKAYYRT